MKKICIAIVLLLAVEAPVIAQTATKKKTTKKTTAVRKKKPAQKTTYYYSKPSKPVVEDGKERPNPYVDPNSPTHDGKEKNINRNINYGTGQEVPPNDGGNVPANSR